MALGTFGIITIAHAVMAVLVIIELGLTGYAVSISDGPFWSPPSSFSFMLFNAIWSILVLVYVAVIPAFAPRLFVTVASLALLAVTSLFWFAGSIAMAVYLGGTDCHGDGSCQAIQAAIAFGFFLWAGFTALAVLEGLAYWRSRGPGAHADGRSKVSAPVV